MNGLPAVLGEPCRWQIAERALGLDRIVIDTRGFDQLLGIGQVEEPVLVQAFVPKLAVETPPQG